MINNLKAQWRLFRLGRKLSQVSKDYAKDIEKAVRDKRPCHEIEQLREERRFEERICSDDIRQIKSRMLCLAAHRLDVGIPLYAEAWEESNVIGGRALTSEGLNELRSAVRKEKNERWAYWETRMKVIGTLVTNAFALYGFMTAIFALMK